MALLRNVTAKNAGRAKYAQEELSWTVSRAQAQTMESLKVDGVELQYWKRVDEGQYCSCGYGLQYSNLPLFTQQPIVPNTPSSNTPTQPMVPTTNTATDSTVTVRGQWDDDDYLEPKHSIKTPPGTDSPVTTDVSSANNYNYSPPQATGEDESFFSAPPDFDLLTGMESTQCGICLGSGKTNPYALIGGEREIFDVFSVDSAYGFHSDTTTRPYSFTTTDNTDAYVQYVYQLPTYFESCLNFSIRNNTKSVRDLGLFYRIAGSSDSWQLVDLDFMNSRRGIPTTVVFRVQPLVNDPNSSLVFTHFEIIWKYADFPLSQVGEMTVAANPQIRESIMSAQFTLPPTLEEVTKNDVFYDNKYNNMWLVSDYTSGMTNKREVLNWSVNARKMQAYEQRSLLRISKERFYEISYSGLRGLSDQLIRNDF